VPSYQASVYSARERKSIRKHFDNLGAARTWREDAAGAVRAGRMRAPTKLTFDQAAEQLIDGMRDGSIIDRSGKAYKPSTIRSYERTLDRRVRPALGHRQLHQLERAEVQRLVDRLRADGLSPSTVANSIDPLRVICRRAIRDGAIAVDPTKGLEMPAVRGRRDRIASPEQAGALLDALPDSERALWTAAFYAGLRRGELRALRWSDVDLDAGVINVQRNMDDDPQVGEVEVKSDAGRRKVPLVGRIRRELVAHKLATGRGGDELVFGRTPQLPFLPSTVRSRALAAWKAAELASFTPHEARHCAASYLIAAGLNPKQISVYIGHSDIRTTYNRYGHLMPRGEAEAAEKLDAFLGGRAAPTAAAGDSR
jgi:integrase